MTLEFCKRLSIFYVSEEIIMAKKKHFNYKDPNIIYSIFNYSRTAYEAYCELVDGNLQYAQEQLNTAGTKLYQAYELALKCYLDKKYKNLYEEKILSWKKYDQLRRCIESGKQSNGSRKPILKLIYQDIILILKETIKEELKRQNVLLSCLNHKAFRMRCYIILQV